MLLSPAEHRQGCLSRETECNPAPPSLSSQMKAEVGGVVTDYDCPQPSRLLGRRLFGRAELLLGRGRAAARPYQQPRETRRTVSLNQQLGRDPSVSLRAGSARPYQRLPNREQARSYNRTPILAKHPRIG